MTIEEIKERCNDNQIEVTSHLMLRCRQRNITYSEIKQAIINGEVIEEYPYDFPYPSCLIFGITLVNRIIHVVVGMAESKLWLITAYEPDRQLWSKDLKTRKD